jgi:hypothetical protein
MLIGDHEPDLVITASPQATPQLEIRLSGVEPQIAQRIARRVIEFVEARVDPNPAKKRSPLDQPLAGRTPGRSGWD